MLFLILQKKVYDKALRVILLLLVVGFFFELVNNQLSSVGQNTTHTVNIFTLVETLALLYFFQQILRSNAVKKLIRISAALFSIAWVVFFSLYGRSKILESILPLEAIGVIALSIYFFYEQVNSPDTTFVYTKSRFWVVIAYLIYIAGTFFLILYFDSLPRAQQKEYYVLNNIFLILKTILLSIAILMKDKPTDRQKFQLT